jgi:hypothetical protein
MRLLLDECVPRKVKFLFANGGHECKTVRDAGVLPQLELEKAFFR